MCGITGIINFNNTPVSRVLIKGMTDELRHRGPDGEGFYFDTQVALGHRRLAIIDLSEKGRQPMSNECGEIWMVFNGEIYNYKQLRKELKDKGHIFNSNTDSEVIIHAYEEYSMDCVKRFNGMWAFAIWDTRIKKLFVSRDRLGVKPFYYYIDKNRFVFASEIKAILVDESIPLKQNDQIIFDFLAFENNDYLDHEKDTFFEGIKRLMPAHNMILDTRGNILIERYWDLEVNNKILEISDNEAALKFYEIFEDAVKLRLQSDVPVGTCLSGGLDSSSIACIINELILENDVDPNTVGEKQKTFSACFEDDACNEIEYINCVVGKLKVEPHFTFPNGKDLFELAPKFINDQGEPVAGTSQWASWLVMRLARDFGVKVLLNGQGADEILAGYGCYFLENFKDLFKKLKLYRLYHEINKYSENHGYSRWWLAKELLRHFIPIHPLQWKRRLLEDEADTFPFWLNKDFIKAYGHNIKSRQIYKGYMDRCLYNFLTFERLPSILRYEDRNSMAFSIEARVPFLDYRLVEFCFSLPSEQKIRNGTGKIVLRNAMKKFLPQIVQERIKKIGFTTPENTWFRTVCRKQIEEIITSKSFKERGYFNTDILIKNFQEFVRGSDVNLRSIWKYVNLELWLREFIDKKYDIYYKNIRSQKMMLSI